MVIVKHHKLSSSASNSSNCPRNNFFILRLKEIDKVNLTP